MSQDDLRHFGNSMFGPDKDVCQACGNESSTYGWVNGVCKSCVEKREEITITKVWLKYLTFFATMLAIVETIINFATLTLYFRIIKKFLSQRLFHYIVKHERRNY